MPGSLIFVVIVAIWAAYLLQHWVRQREDAAATRSVHGFSEAMRVLEKRPPLPTADLREPRPHSYAVRPGRAARPTVDVERAVPAGASMASAVSGAPSPLVARRAADRVPTTPKADQMTSQQSPDPQTPDPQTAGAASWTTRHRPSRGAERPPRPVARPRVSRAQRRLRAALLLVSLLWIPVSVVLAITGTPMWLSIPFAVLTFAAVLVWLRTEAAADRDRAARATSETLATPETRETPETADASAHRQHRPHRPHRLVRRPRRELTSDDTQVIHHAPAARSTAAAAHPGEGATPSDPAPDELSEAPAAHSARPTTRASSAAYDVMAVEAAQVRPPAHEAPAEQVPGTWQPVPVPRPTYAMKVKAEPRLTPSGIPADVFDTAEFADEADELDERARFVRRAASQ